MKKTALLLTIFAVLSGAAIAQQAKLKYTVNLNDIADDQFKVVLDVKGLKAENNIYQFASTAPGTYQVMDIGRFVREFKAYDKKGVELPVTKVSENQYQLSNPQTTAKITYHIAETWDTQVDRDAVYKMCGSSLEKDNVLINGQCVFGYPKGMQSEPIEIKLEYPAAWLAGSSMKKNKAGNYYAETYDQLVDSPILLGNLTVASTQLGKATVDIFTYSKTGLVKSDQLLTSMKTMLSAADAFIGGLPVDRYTFLFHFEDGSAGAWEHSYGSEYVLQEEPYTEQSGRGIADIAAHEFFHVVTPLNIHSEIIEKFNFVTPTPSEHLWLYEGTTEWASDMFQLRYGMVDLKEYLSQLSQKLAADAQYDSTYSLVKLSQTSYTPEGQRQYGNIYARGAFVAGLLDIRLLELSKGTRGYREVIQELAKKFGPKKAFPETEFFNLFTAMTYPEIGQFFETYVKNANPLPVKEYYSKIGIRYDRVVHTGKMVPQIGAAFGPGEGSKIILSRLRKEFADFGFAGGDEVLAVNGEPVSFANVRAALGKLRSQAIGSAYTITISRNGEEKTIDGKVLSVEDAPRFVFAEDPNATPEQIALRNTWMKSLK